MFENAEVEGAFADYIGVAFKHLRKALPKLQTSFVKFGISPGLIHNIAKYMIFRLAQPASQSLRLIPQP